MKSLVAASIVASVAAASALANPCPPAPPPSTSPPYLLLTGSVVVTSDSIGAGNINTCGINGGTLEVAGTLTNNGMLLITPGGGQLNVDAGGSLANMSGAQFLAVAGSVSNGGTITNAGIFDPTAPFNNSGTVNNVAGGQMIEVGAMTSSGSITNDADFRITQAVGFVSSLTNSGTVTNTAAGTFSIILGATLTNSGSVANAGTVHDTGNINNQAAGQLTNTGIFVNGDPTGGLPASTTNSGTLANTGSGASFANGPRSIVANSGTLLNQAGAGFINSGTVTDGGTLNNSGTGTTFANAGSATVSGAGLFNNFNGAAVNNSATFSVAGGGTLANSSVLNNDTLGTLAVTGSLQNSNGTINNANGATINVAGTLENSSATVSGATGDIDNHGTLAGSGTFTNHIGGLLTNEADGSLQNLANGTWTNEAGAEIDLLGSWSNNGTISNAGTVRVTGNLTGSGTYTQTAGLTKMLGGTIQQAAISIQGGQLLGAGTLSGGVLVSATGTIGPGDPNTLTIRGPLTVSGNLLVQIAGNGTGQYDVVKVVGNAANLTNGTITFQFLSGYVPPANVTFKGVLAADGGITGLAGVKYAFLGLPQAPAYQVVADGTGIDLVLGSGSSGSVSPTLMPIAGPDATYGNPGVRPDVFAMDAKGRVSVSMSLAGSNGDAILRSDGNSAAALLYQLTNPGPVNCGSAPVTSGSPTYQQGVGGVLSTNAAGKVGFAGQIFCGYPGGFNTAGDWLLDPAAALAPVADPLAANSLASNPAGLAMNQSGAIAGSPSDMSNLNAGGAAAVTFYDATGSVALSPTLSVISPAGTAVGYAFDADIGLAGLRTHPSLNDAGNVVAGYNISNTTASNGAYLAYFDPRVSRVTSTQGTVDNLHLALGPTLAWPLAGSAGPVLNNRGYAGLLLEDSNPAGQYLVALAALDPTLAGSPSVATLIGAGVAGTGNFGGRFCGTAAVNGFNQVVFISGTGAALAPGASGSCGQALWLLDPSGFTPQKIAAAGDSFSFGGQTWTITSLAATAQQSINDAGQVAFGAGATAGATSATFVLRYDPPAGTTPGTPILPANFDPANPPAAPWSLVVPNALTQAVASGECVGPPELVNASINSALQCQRVIYLDPTLANGYQFQANAGAPNFAGVMVPAPLASGTSTFVVQYGTQTVTVAAGRFLDFTAAVPGGVASFAITGLTGADALDAANPAAFVTGVVFAGPSTSDVTVTMTPLSGSGPAITPSVAGTLGANGWYVTSVTVSFTVDGTATSSSGCGSVTINADTPGQTITCTAANALGTTNSTVTVKRDATAPVVGNVPAGVTATATQPSGATVTYTAPTATDATSGLATGGGCQPASGSNFPVGTTTVTCSYSDLAGNTSGATFDVTVQLPAAPAISSSVSGQQGNNGWYTGNVTVAFTVTGATSQTAGCSGATLSTDSAGTTYTCSASNAGGTTTSTVTVKRDATAPALASIGTVNASATGASGVAVSYAMPAASDAMSGLAGSVSCTPASGSVFPVGTTAVTCTVSDNAGNSASSTGHVVVTGPVACHDESLSVRPDTVRRGDDLQVSAQIHNCADTAQSLSEQFTLSGPFGSSCAMASEVLRTTPAFRLAAGAARNIGFEASVPRTACRGSYSVTATTRSGGTVVDSSTARFTVR